MVYEEIYVPRLSDYGRDGKLTPNAVLCILEDVGCHHLATVNDDVLQSSLSGISWIISNWRIGIRGEAPCGEKLRVCTWSRKRSGITTVLREFTIHGENGREIIAAEAKFALWNMKTGSPVRISDELMEAYKSEDIPVFADELKRLTPPDAFSSTKDVPLRKSDIDFNGHMHNTRYLDVACEGDDGFGFWNVHEVNVAYRKPMIETDTVTVSAADTEEGRFISVNNRDGACCFIELKK